MTSQPRSRPSVLAVWVLAGLLIAGAAAIRYLLIPSAPEKPPEAETSFTAIGMDLDSSLPAKGGPEGYVSSSACQECHPKQHQTWHRSYHRTMTQVMTTNTVQADFNDVVMDFQGERFTLRHKDDLFWVELEDLEERSQSALTGVPPPEPLRIRMSMMTGSHHMQVFWVPGGHGNLQMGFPFTWLIKDRRWVPRNDAFIRPPDHVQTKEVWNLTCIRCHTTAGQPRPNAQDQVFETNVGELGIACEACHGPGEAHVKRQTELAQLQQIQPEPERKTAATDPTIVQPQNLTHVRSSQVCGSCHSMKWFDDSEGWKEHGFRFRPGQDLEATTPIIRPNQIEAQPWLQKALKRNPDLLEDFFWPDGMIRVAGREFNGLIESPCFQRGQLSCLSCHSMHYYEAPDDQLSPGMESNEACLQCHQSFRDDLSRHTRHAPDSSGSLCYNCHMPHTSYALLKAIRSHQIDSPSAASTVAAGRPNACNLCHLDQTLAWTSRHLTEWFGQPSVELSEAQQSVADSLVWLLSGDAGQRALAAWSFGWEPARRISGQDWMLPHLAHLLEDPYSAVRYIAHHSLQGLTELGAPAYDFSGPEGQRNAARQKIISSWPGAASTVDPARLGRLLLKPDGTLDTGRAAGLQAKRNDRPVRLRE